MSYLFTSESVSEGHPDKIADQISDAILDNFIALDENSKVACETMVTTGQVILSGEVKSKAYLDLQKIARDTIRDIGYNNSNYRFDYKSCGILSCIHEQSENIYNSVNKEIKEQQGAGDQGMMFGYATNETESYIPVSLYLSHKIVKELTNIRKYENSLLPYLRPDAKAQVTIKYDKKKPISIDTIVISTQHDEFGNDLSMNEKITNDLKKILIPRIKEKLSIEIRELFSDNIKYHINPSGKFVIGGPHGDTGLTGRKIVVDTYGGKGAHGGGAFSGKDPSKVDRSAAYAIRHISKNLVASGLCDEVLVQVAYAIGVSNPVSIFVNTYNTCKLNISDEDISNKILDIFDMTPFGIQKRLKLKNPIYKETACYGHFGRKNKKINKKFYSNNKIIEKEVELFTWEKLDFVNKICEIFNL